MDIDYILEVTDEKDLVFGYKRNNFQRILVQKEASMKGLTTEQCLQHSTCFVQFFLLCYNG